MLCNSINYNNPNNIMNDGSYEYQTGSGVASQVFGAVLDFCPVVKVYLYAAVFFAIVYFLAHLIKRHELPSLGSIIMQLCSFIMCTILIAGLCVYNGAIAWLFTGVLMCCMSSGLWHMIKN